MSTPRRRCSLTSCAAWSGGRRRTPRPDPLGRAAIRYFATAVGDHNPVYTDDDAARAAGHDGVVAPPTLVCETNQFVNHPRDDDGYPGHEWGIELPGTRLVRGGNDYTFHQPVSPDDVITVDWEITDVTERTTGSGQPMLVVTSIASVHQPARRPAGREQGDADLPGGRVVTRLAVGDEAPPLERTMHLADMVAYAGATWDWHRLHYDSAWLGERGSTAPVVDGQMFGALHRRADPGLGGADGAAQRAALPVQEPRVRRRDDPLLGDGDRGRR